MNTAPATAFNLTPGLRVKGRTRTGKTVRLQITSVLAYSVAGYGADEPRKFFIIPQADLLK